MIRVRVALGLLVAIAPLPAGSPSPAALPERGARGVALTVLEGNRIEEIPVVYLGIHEDFVGPGYDLHLVRLEGPAAERVGVAAGMSGSPVYFDGRLLGALSYRMGALPREPVAGVTPAEQMREAADPARASAAVQSHGVRPIATPLAAGGLAPRIRAWLGEQLEPLGFVLVGGGSMGGASEDTPLRPGSPVGVELVRGDLRIAATGTVTWVEGNRVYAFGHPFLGSGRVALPMVSAEVVHTLADLAGSVKLARVGSELGALVDDRLTAVVGETGRTARMIPLELSVHGADYGRRRFGFEIARSRRLAPLLAAGVVANALIANTGYGDRSTMRLTGRVRLGDELPELPLDMAFAGEGASDPGLSVALGLQQLLVGLWNNPLGEVAVEALEIDVAVDREVRLYRVAQLLYDRGPVRPGETLAVRCLLERYRGDPVTRELSITVPPGLAPGAEVLLAVGPPAQVDRALGRPLSRRLRSAEDLRGLVRALGERRSAHRLTAVLYHRAPGVVTRGSAYETLPPSAERLLGSRHRAGDATPIPVSPLGTSVVELDGPVTGGLAVRLRVRAQAGEGEDRGP